MKKLFFLIIFIFILNNINIYSEEKNFFSSAIDELKKIELSSEGRIGVFAVNTENEDFVQYRADEIFPTQCTSKVIGVAAVLKKSMTDQSILFKRINYSQKDIEKAKWAPVTKNYVSQGMIVKDLCRAAINNSDSVAMNLLLDVIGGINGMNNFAKSIGDNVYRQDNDWPLEGYSGGEGNIYDSSSPKAMINSFRKITLGDVLSRPQRDLLTEYLIDNQTGFKRIRASVPKDWIVGDKTGTGILYGSTNDIAIIFPPNHAPLLIGIYYTSNKKDAVTRDDLLAEATKIVINEFIKKDSKLKSK